MVNLIGGKTANEIAKEGIEPGQPETPKSDFSKEDEAAMAEIRARVGEKGKRGEEREKQADAQKTLAHAKKRAGFFGRLLGTPFRITAACTKACTTAAFTVPFIPFSRRIWKAVFSSLNPVTTIGNIGQAMKEEYEVTYDSFFGKLKSPDDKNHP